MDTVGRTYTRCTFDVISRNEEKKKAGHNKKSNSVGNKGSTRGSQELEVRAYLLVRGGN